SLERVHAIGVVNLARLTGYLSILPTALSVCTMLQKSIVHGFTRSDGVWEQPLTADDLGRCFELRGDLGQANAAIMLKILSSTTDLSCLEPSHCQEKLALVLGIHPIPFFAADFAPAGVAPAWKPYDESLQGAGLCDDCRDSLGREYRSEHRELCRRLPKMLGIEVDGWDKSD
ncbi:hypothetical protein C8T65DRAFT_587951, partial [Cerioporus squamosus]